MTLKLELMKHKVLYITYDGLTDALGQSQILSYLTKLSTVYEFYVLSFEKQLSYQKSCNRVEKSVADNGLIWIKKWYTKSPPIVSTIYDINVALKEVKQLHKKHSFDIVHCRGYIPALIGLQLRRRFTLKFIFDMRGWWPDEKVESGSWVNPIFRPVYNYFKKKEKAFFQCADYIISLTEAGKEEIISKFHVQPDKVGVVPTCVDFEIFKEPSPENRQKIRKQIGIDEDARVLIYSGALGGNYDISILKSFFLAFNAHFPNVFIIILSKDIMAPEFEADLKQEGITKYLVKNVTYTEVSDYLCAADTGLIFYKPAFSNIGRSPTKLGEYWASGIPVLATQGIGDVDRLQQSYSGGLVLTNNQFKDIKVKLAQLQFGQPALLRQYARNYCSLEKGIKFYDSVYKRLIK